MCHRVTGVKLYEGNVPRARARARLLCTRLRIHPAPCCGEVLSEDPEMSSVR